MKTIENQGREQVADLKVLKPDIQPFTIKDAISEDQLNKEAKDQIEKIEEIKTMLNKDESIFETN